MKKKINKKKKSTPNLLNKYAEHCLFCVKYSHQSLATYMGKETALIIRLNVYST